jgi:hypothetical protein
MDGKEQPPEPPEPPDEEDRWSEEIKEGGRPKPE